jgi:hypothetical protein
VKKNGICVMPFFLSSALAKNAHFSAILVSFSDKVSWFILNPLPHQRILLSGIQVFGWQAVTRPSSLFD